MALVDAFERWACKHRGKRTLCGWIVRKWDVRCLQRCHDRLAEHKSLLQISVGNTD